MSGSRTGIDGEETLSRPRLMAQTDCGTPTVSRELNEVAVGDTVVPWLSDCSGQARMWASHKNPEL